MGSARLEQLLRPWMALREDVVADGPEQLSPGALALDGVVATCHPGCPGRVVPLEALRVQEAAGHAVAGLWLDTDGGQHGCTDALRVPDGEGQGGAGAHRQAGHVEALEPEAIGEGDEVLDQHPVAPTPVGVPARSGMASGIGQVEGEVLAQQRALGRPVLGRRRGRRVQ